MSGMSDMGSTGTNGSMSMKMYFHGSIGSDMLWFESWMPSSAGATVGVCIGLFILAVFERYLVAFRRACDDTWRKGIIALSLPTTAGPYTSSSPSPSTYSSSLTPPNTSRRISTQKYTSSPDIEDAPPSLSSSSAEEGRVPTYTPDDSSRASEKSQEGVFGHLPKAVIRGMSGKREGRWSRPFRLGVDLPRGLLQSLQTLLHYLLMLMVMSFNIWWILSVVVGAGIGEMLFGRFGSGSSGAGH